MATRTISVAGGNWSAGTAWLEGAAPIASDNVVATALSGDLVVTAASVCRSADFTTYVGTLSGSGDLTIGDGTAGPLTLATGMTITYTGAVKFASTAVGNVITNNAKSLASAITFDGVGGAWSLADALLTTGALTLTNGTFSDGGKNVTAASFSSSNANVRTLTLGACTWNLTGTGTVWTLATSTNLTLTTVPAANVIELSDASVTGKTFAGGGKTYGEVRLDGGGSGAVTITGANTFNEFAIAAPKSVIFPASVTQTFIEAPEWRGASGSVITITSSSSGTPATLSTTETAACDWLSLKDSAAVGTGAVWRAGANSTNVSGNSGWSFTAGPSTFQTRISLGIGLSLP